MSNHWALILIEGVLILGGVLLFAWWQLGSMAREQRERRQQARNHGEHDRPDEGDTVFRLHDEPPR
jgi:hypothetical protein